jgi:hypothetical protein
MSKKEIFARSGWTVFGAMGFFIFSNSMRIL